MRQMHQVLPRRGLIRGTHGSVPLLCQFARELSFINGTGRPAGDYVRLRQMSGGYALQRQVTTANKSAIEMS